MKQIVRAKVAPGVFVACLLLGACGEDSHAPPDLERIIFPTYRITGVKVQPADITHQIPWYIAADTVRAELVYRVSTERLLIKTDTVWMPRDAVLDLSPGTIVNPTLHSRRWLSFDRPVRYRGVEIPANTNLFTIPSIATGIRDLEFYQLWPFSTPPQGVIRPNMEVFEFSPGSYVATARWESTEGEIFSDTARVYIDIKK